MSATKLLMTLFALAAMASAPAAAQSKGNRIVDMEAEFPEGIRPIRENIRKIETQQQEFLAKQGKMIADLQARHLKAPGDTRIEGQLYKAKSDAANAIVASETSLGAEYDSAADKTRQLAANMQPCVARPEIAQQREYARKKLADLTARSEQLRKGPDAGDKSANEQLVQIAGQLTQAIAILSRLDEAEQEQARHCAEQTRQLAQLNWWADKLSLDADLHYIRAAQATVDSLLDLIRLQNLADQETLDLIVKDLITIQPGGYNAVHELEQILRGKQ